MKLKEKNFIQVKTDLQASFLFYFKVGKLKKSSNISNLNKPTNKQSEFDYFLLFISLTND